MPDQNIIAQFGWPKYQGEAKVKYLINLLMSGYKVNSHQWNAADFNYLNSYVHTTLRKKKFPLSHTTRKIPHPLTRKVSITPVIVVWMTDEQKQEWLDRNTNRGKLRL